MQNGGFISYEEYERFQPSLYCMGVRLMPDEEELEQRVNDMIDRERVKEAILSLEISQMRKTLDKLNERV